MVRISGNVNPYQAGRVPFQRELGLGRWNMEYDIVKDGKVIRRGSFQSNSDGSFDLNIDAPGNSTVRIRCLGGWGYETTESSVHISNPNDMVSCGTIHMREK